MRCCGAARADPPSSLPSVCTSSRPSHQRWLTIAKSGGAQWGLVTAGTTDLRAAAICRAAQPQCHLRSASGGSHRLQSSGWTRVLRAAQLSKVMMNILGGAAVATGSHQQSNKPLPLVAICSAESASALGCCSTTSPQVPVTMHRRSGARFVGPACAVLPDKF